MTEISKYLKSNAANFVSLAAVPFSLAAFYYIDQGQAFLSLVFICISFIIDTLDGQVARKLNIENNQGRIIDSFGDMIAYLLFPCFFIYKFLNFNLWVTLATCSLIMFFGIWRLSRFTTDGFLVVNGKKYYKGVITPFVLVATAIFYAARHHGIQPALYLFHPAMAILSVMMVSNIKLLKTASWPWYLMAALLLWITY